MFNLGIYNNFLSYKLQDTVVQNEDSGISESLDESCNSTYSSDDSKSSSMLSMKYDNSNIHELPL